MRADCDCLPSGERLRLVSGLHVETGGGTVPLPQGQDLIYPRLAPDGVRFAGIGHRDDLAWLWDGTSWVSDGLAFGPRAVIFDAAGVLQVIRPPGPAVGYRYVAEDGRLVTANETIHDPARRIWEYSTFNGVTIGQGGDGPDGEDPCIAVFDDGQRRLIHKGRCRLINVTYDAAHDLFAIALVEETTAASLFFWLTRAQILALPEPTPVEPEPDPERPTCRIVSYPPTVTFGQPAICGAEYGGGPATLARWRSRALGEAVWITNDVQAPPQPIYAYRFDNPGTFDISLRVEGPGGADETMSLRRITVEDIVDPDPGPKPTRQQIAFGFDIGSLDAQQCFTEPDKWQYGWDRISSCHFYLQNILDLDPVIVGPNTYANLVAAGAFWKVKDAGIFLEAELAGPAQQVFDAEARILAAGGVLNGVVWDNCFDGITPDEFESYVKELQRERPHILIGVFAAFPMKTAEQIRERFVEWDKRGCAKPLSFLRLDIDPGRLSAFTKADYAILRTIATDYELTLQVVINAADGLTDAQYVARAWDKYQTLKAIGKFDGLAVQSWASTQPASQGPRTVPHNLPESDASSHTALLRRVLGDFQ